MNTTRPRYSMGEATIPNASSQSVRSARTVTLLDGEVVSEAFYLRLKQMALDEIPRLIRGKEYTAEQLCSVGSWATLWPGEQKLAGKCFSNIAALKELPLEPFMWEHEYPLKYRIL